MDIEAPDLSAKALIATVAVAYVAALVGFPAYERYFRGSYDKAAQAIFPAAEARRLLRRLEFHYVPKHASWLNMVEIEIGVLRGQCLDRRIAPSNNSYPKSPPGNDSSTPQKPASNGCSQPTKLAPRWAAPTPNQQPRPKSHNHCAEVLAQGASTFDRGSCLRLHWSHDPLRRLALRPTRRSRRAG
jgi:hypothetical protein